MKRIFAGIPASVAEAGEISAGSMWMSFPSQRIRLRPLPRHYKAVLYSMNTGS
jgi:hypothetical protein